MSEIYTAQEMRAVADTPVYIGNDCANKTQRLMRNMLRQAAETRERCEAKLYSMRFDHHSPEIEDVKDFIEEMLVYIILGDAVKEENND